MSSVDPFHIDPDSQAERDDARRSMAALIWEGTRNAGRAARRDFRVGQAFTELAELEERLAEAAAQLDLDEAERIAAEHALVRERLPLDAAADLLQLGKRLLSQPW